MSQAGFRELRFPAADGLELFCRLYDAAPAGALTVLCLPGLTRNSRDFEALAPHLAKRYRVACPDLRGRGLSAWDPKWQNYHPGQYFADLQRLIERLAAPRIAIIGTSLGGLLAMMMGASAPELVAGIVLNDVGPEIDPRGVERIKSYVGRLPPVRTWADAVAQLRQVYESAWPGLSAEAWSRLVQRSYRADADGIPRLDADPKIGDALRAAPAAPAGLWPVFSRLEQMPLLVIHGALSDILTEPILARMQREKPDLARVTVANRGHVPLLDEPEALAAIDRFLAHLTP
jgi:pimeloyl-ACP methyl ester carboxylesterase